MAGISLEVICNLLVKLLRLTAFIVLTTGNFLSKDKIREDKLAQFM